jgi:hypothetical protein
MRAVLVEAPGSVAIREVPDPTPGPAALVRIERVGLCGTDRKIVHGTVAVDRPRILGHELIGRVAIAGQRNQLPEGTRVLIDPNIACGRCPVCRHDRPHLCPHGALTGRDVDGGCAVAHVPLVLQRAHDHQPAISPAEGLPSGDRAGTASTTAGTAGQRQLPAARGSRSARVAGPLRPAQGSAGGVNTAMHIDWVFVSASTVDTDIFLMLRAFSPSSPHSPAGLEQRSSGGRSSVGANRAFTGEELGVPGRHRFALTPVPGMAARLAPSPHHPHSRAARFVPATSTAITRRTKAQ